MATSSPIKERRCNTDRRAVAKTVMPLTMQSIEWIPMIFIAFGGLNWGAIGMFDLNLVAYLCGEMTVLTRIIYVLVGMSALYAMYVSKRIINYRRY